MATDFNKPVVTDNYAVMLPAIAQAHKDLAMMLEPTLTSTSTNLPTGAVRWNATTVRWERYNGSSWVTLPAAGNNVYAISISGNAATTTALATARTIGGVSFNGTANINLPGVNTAGNQNTSGNAATATKLATARTIGGVSFDGTANINLPGVNTTGNQNTTGNAATATLATNATTAASCSGNAATVTNGVYTTGDQSIYGVKQFAEVIIANISGNAGGNASTATKLVNDTGAPPSYSCRAWVNFNGVGSVSIRASGNVSSITDNGVGDYTINFITSMPDVNYSLVTSGARNAPGAHGAIVCGLGGASPGLVNSYRLRTTDSAGILEDFLEVSAAVFR